MSLLTRTQELVDKARAAAARLAADDRSQKLQADLKHGVSDARQRIGEAVQDVRSRLRRD